MKTLNHEERAVNTPVSKKVRQEIKARAALEGVTMQEYVEKVLAAHWEKERKPTP